MALFPRLIRIAKFKCSSSNINPYSFLSSNSPAAHRLNYRSFSRSVKPDGKVVKPDGKVVNHRSISRRLMELERKVARSTIASHPAKLQGEIVHLLDKFNNIGTLLGALIGSLSGFGIVYFSLNAGLDEWLVRNFLLRNAETEPTGPTLVTFMKENMDNYEDCMSDGLDEFLVRKFLGRNGETEPTSKTGPTLMTSMKESKYKYEDLISACLDEFGVREYLLRNAEIARASKTGPILKTSMKENKDKDED